MLSRIHFYKRGARLAVHGKGDQHGKEPHQGAHCVERGWGYERGARLVVDREGDQHHQELHQEADRVDQVGRKVGVRRLGILLLARTTNAS